MKELDYIIVGQGLAGTLLSYFLLQENQRILVVDASRPNSSSKIAAGVVNPVTGRRQAKSWRYEELFQFAKNTYRALEQELGISIWKERNILRALHNNFEENEWLRRGAFPDYQAFFKEEAELGGFEGKVGEAHAWGELKGSAQTDMPTLLSAFRKKLEAEELILEEQFDYAQIKFGEARVSYRDFSARQIVFCEGAKAVENPFFNFLPFSLTKGELLLVEIPGADFQKMLKHHLFIVPLSNGLYWAGSTSRFEYEDDLPSQEKRKWLEEQLSKTIRLPYKIIAHQAGIRPTVHDIRPFLGVHPERQGLAVFNGLGTKGASLGPLFANQLANFLLGRGALDKTVDIARFKAKA